MTEITHVLNALEQGDPQAAEKLLLLVYAELRQLAAQKLAKENPGQTLEATALVHEAYLRLIDAELLPRWNSRGHFFAAAAEAMRRILVENARLKKSQKRGGDFHRVALDKVDVPEGQRDEKLLALDEALSKLEQQNPLQARLVNLRWFAGLTIQEAAELLEISTATADRYWAYARAWLQREMSPKE